MVDTVRALAALQTLLPSSSPGAISAQDLRDFLVSAVLQGTSGDVSITIADTDNVQALTITCNDVTNGPRVVRIINNGAGNALRVDQDVDASNSRSVGGGTLIENTGSQNTALNIYTNHSATAQQLVRIEADNVGANNGLLLLRSDATSGSDEELQIKSNHPAILLDEFDQTSPAGKYELQVSGNRFQVNSRNAADNSFETSVEFQQLRQGGEVVFFGYTSHNEILSAPTGEASKAKLYAEDNGAGKTRLMVIFQTGVAQQIAIEA